MIKTYRPSMEEFRNFPNLINAMEEDGAHRVGIAKIVPPTEHEFKILPMELCPSIMSFHPLRQKVEQMDGIPGVYLYSSKATKEAYTYKTFREKVSTPEYRAPLSGSTTLYDEVKRGLLSRQPLYGAEIVGSLFTEDNVWNINRLETFLNKTVQFGDEGRIFPGINRSMLYVGSYGSIFPIHIEDVCLYSANVQLFGAPKNWFGIPPEQGWLLESVANQCFPKDYKACPTFLQHKSHYFDVDFLRSCGITVNEVTQNLGEIIITFPNCYHQGYNMGYNINESANFALERWKAYCQTHKVCKDRYDKKKGIAPVKLTLRKEDTIVPAPKFPDSPNKMEIPIYNGEKVQFEGWNLVTKKQEAICQDRAGMYAIVCYDEYAKNAVGPLNPKTPKSGPWSCHLPSCENFEISSIQKGNGKLSLTLENHHKQYHAQQLSINSDTIYRCKTCGFFERKLDRLKDHQESCSTRRHK